MGTSALGPLLIREGLLSNQDLATIRRTSGQDAYAFAKGIIALGLLDEEGLAAFIADRTSFRVMGREDVLKSADPKAISRLDVHLLAHLEVLPIQVTGDSLVVAMADPLDKGVIRQLEFFTGLKIQAVVATFSQIYAGLKKIIPGFEPDVNPLMDLFNNHAVAASNRLKVQRRLDAQEILSIEQEHERAQSHLESSMTNITHALLPDLEEAHQSLDAMHNSSEAHDQAVSEDLNELSVDLDSLDSSDLEGLGTDFDTSDLDGAAPLGSPDTAKPASGSDELDFDLNSPLPSSEMEILEVSTPRQAEDQGPRVDPMEAVTDPMDLGLGIEPSLEGLMDDFESPLNSAEPRAPAEAIDEEEAALEGLRLDPAVVIDSNLDLSGDIDFSLANPEGPTEGVANDVEASPQEAQAAAEHKFDFTHEAELDSFALSSITGTILGVSMAMTPEDAAEALLDGLKDSVPAGVLYRVSAGEKTCFAAWAKGTPKDPQELSGDDDSLKLWPEFADEEVFERDFSAESWSLRLGLSMAESQHPLFQAELMKLSQILGSKL